MGTVYGIDIGTSNFKMCCKDKEQILNEKNIIAIANKKDLLAFGDEAYEMYEKAPENIEVSFPVKYGVIADIENMQTLLLQFYNKINNDKKSAANTDFYIAVPTDVTEVEKRAFYELVADSKVKAKNIYIVDKPVADAIGAGLDVTKSRGIMIVNIGAETTEISVLSLNTDLRIFDQKSCKHTDSFSLCAHKQKSVSAVNYFLVNLLNTGIISYKHCKV